MTEARTDEAGLAALVSAHRADLRAFLSARCGDPAEADDLLQELWLKVAGLPSGPIANGRAYLFRVANNLVLDRVRARHRAMRRDRSWLDDGAQRRARQRGPARSRPPRGRSADARGGSCRAAAGRCRAAAGRAPGSGIASLRGARPGGSGANHGNQPQRGRRRTSRPPCGIFAGRSPTADISVPRRHGERGKVVTDHEQG